MLIVCAGRSRSGSTLLYNIIRLTLIEAFGKEKVYARGLRNYKHNHEKKYNVVKLHDTDDAHFENNATYVFSSRRNEEEQRESVIRFRKIMKNQNISKKSLDEFIEYDFTRYRKWVTHRNFVKTFDYEDLVHNKEKVIKYICKILKINVDSDLVIEKVNNLKMPDKKTKIDPETCLTWKHITGD
jgi:hypothetical protein